MKRKIDLKYFAFSIGLLIAFYYTNKTYSQLLLIIKSIITYPKLGLYAAAVSTIFTILPKIKTHTFSFSSKMSFKEFRASINDIISFIDNPIVLVGTLAILKGIFIYYTENNRFFPLFNQYEITLILLVSLYLLVTSLLELWKNIIDTWCKYVTNSGDPMADTSKDTKNRDVPPPIN